MEYSWLAFNKEWFNDHQPILLWLCNNWLLKYWFRWILRIHRDLKWKERVCQLRPNSCTVFLGLSRDSDPRFRYEGRTHPKFSKRIYYAFKPLWWALHGWDWVCADRYVPQLSFGFGSLTKKPNAQGDSGINTTDGPLYSYNTTGATWSTMRAAAGTDVRPGATADMAYYSGSSTTTNKYTYLGRSMFLFDTSSLTANAILDTTVLSVIGRVKANGLNWSAGDSTLWPVASTPASNVTLANGDYQQVGSIKFGNTGVLYADFATAGAYIGITFNATGMNAVSLTSITKLGIRSGADFSDTQPGWVSNISSYLGTYFADYTGTSSDPKLVITYHFNFSASLGDTVTLTEGVVKGIRPVYTATFSLGDAIAKRPQVIYSDGISLGESIYKGPRLSKADSITISDANILSTKKVIADSVVLSDILVKTFRSNLADLISLVDGLSKRVGLPIADGITLSEFFSYILTTGGKHWTKSLSDNIYLTDLIKKAPHIFKADAISILDQIIKLYNLKLRDSIVLSDVFLRSSLPTASIIFEFVHKKRTMQKGEQGGDFEFIHRGKTDTAIHEKSELEPGDFANAFDPNAFEVGGWTTVIPKDIKDFLFKPIKRVKKE